VVSIYDTVLSRNVCSRDYQHYSEKPDICLHPLIFGKKLKLKKKKEVYEIIIPKINIIFKCSIVYVTIYSLTDLQQFIKIFLNSLNLSL
jgi:hypothetical protein